MCGVCSVLRCCHFPLADSKWRLTEESELKASVTPDSWDSPGSCGWQTRADQERAAISQFSLGKNPYQHTNFASRCFKSHLSLYNINESRSFLMLFEWLLERGAVGGVYSCQESLSKLNLGVLYWRDSYFAGGGLFFEISWWSLQFVRLACFFIALCWFYCRYSEFVILFSVGALLNGMSSQSEPPICFTGSRCLVTDQRAFRFWSLHTNLKQVEGRARERAREQMGGGFPAVSGGMPGGLTWGSEVLGGSWLGTNQRNGTPEICRTLMILTLPLPGRFSTPGPSKWSVPLGILTSRPRYPWLLFNVWLLANESRDFHQVWLQKY